ncbi:hypothetical protein ACG02S_02165 [Roseateles sp. DC23W]|uniref:Uncharacterized protein n=1 Tax=Pelomonas dachongensis TaxID=3299029 RepID=A0ABW7EGV7_9BURK
MSKKMNPQEFEQLRPTLRARLSQALEEEQSDDLAVPDLKDNPMWETPEVDSKSVAKLSPLVKEITGSSLRPEWIQKGGYASIFEAVTDIIAKIHQHRVGIADAPASSPSEVNEEVAAH